MRSRLTALLALALAGSSPAAAQLTVRVAVPASTPAGAPVYVAGSFNSWTPDDPHYRLSPLPLGGYALTLPDSVRGAVEFKFTRGSWETAEVTASGDSHPNRRFTIRASGADTVDASVERWADASAAPPKRHTASASVIVMSDTVAIPQLGRSRRVWLYLPAGYGTSRARYPVLYLQDGQNVFDDATSYAGEWGVDESLDSLRRLGDRGVIVVAVDNGGPRRLDEYNPWKNANPKLGGGEGDAYVDFLVHTLKPYVDAHFRTDPAPASTGIGGSSAGALIALYATLEHPDVFGRAMLFSTASWLTGAHLLERARLAAPHRPAPKFYFMSGAFETADGQLALDQRRMVDTLKAYGVPADSIRSVVMADGKHAEWFWRREFPDAYRWLFGRARDDAAPRAPAP